MSGRPYILTASGAAIDLLDPAPDAVTLPDIAHALARICRYTGHVRCAHYSVAEHSIHVARYLRDHGHSAGIQAQGLLHDAPEAYTGDMASPIKRALRRISSTTQEIAPIHPWDVFEARHAAAVRARFRLPAELSPAVHAADLALLMAEARDLMPTDAGDGWPDVAPSEGRIYAGMAPYTAAIAFLAEAERLGIV